MDAIEWIREERIDLLTDFAEAARSAARSPDPRDPESWSIRMHGLADRVRASDALLDAPADWQSILWDVWPFLEQISRVAVPIEAWEWLEAYAQRGCRGQSQAALVARVLSFRPTAIR